MAEQTGLVAQSGLLILNQTANMASEKDTRSGCKVCADGSDSTFDISMAFQPIVDVDERSIFAYEALVRGVDRGRLVGPGLIPKHGYSDPAAGDYCKCFALSEM